MKYTNIFEKISIQNAYVNLFSKLTVRGIKNHRRCNYLCWVNNIIQNSCLGDACANPLIKMKPSTIYKKSLNLKCSQRHRNIATIVLYGYEIIKSSTSHSNTSHMVTSSLFFKNKIASKILCEDADKNTQKIVEW